MENVKIVALVGMSGSGKSVAVDYLTEKGYPKIYFGGMIYKEMEKRACNREEMAKKWFISTNGNGQMYVQTIIPKEHTPKGTAWLSLPE